MTGSVPFEELSPMGTMATADTEKLGNFSFPAMPQNISLDIIKGLRGSMDRGYDITGNTEFLSKDLENYIMIDKFASKLVKEQEPVPEEFEKIFQEKFWDILA